MSTFADEDEVYTYLAEIFRIAFARDDIRPTLDKAGLRMRVVYSDPQAHLLIDMTNGSVLTGAEAAAADWDVAMEMAADTGHRFWLGKVNFTVAMTRGQIRTQGSVPKMLKLLPLTRKLFAVYQELLVATDRTDLLNAG